VKILIGASNLILVFIFRTAQAFDVESGLIDPPRDLIIEIDITSTSLDRFSIFAEVGVVEVWHFDGKRLTIHELKSGNYEERDTSVAFARIPAAEITALIKESEKITRPEWVRRLRLWIREHLSE